MLLRHVGSDDDTRWLLADVRVEGSLGSDARP